MTSNQKLRLLKNILKRHKNLFRYDHKANPWYLLNELLSANTENLNYKYIFKDLFGIGYYVDEVDSFLSNFENNINNSINDLESKIALTKKTIKRKKNVRALDRTKKYI